MSLNLRSAALLIGTAFAANGVVSAQDFPPAKVAIINLQQAVAETKEIKKAVSALEVKYGPRQKTIEALQREMQDIQKQAGTPNLAPDREAMLQTQFNAKQKQLQRLNDDLQADVNADRQDILGRTGRQMADVVKKIAEGKNLDVVIDVSTTLYFKPALDITTTAIAEFDKAHPAQ